MLFLRIIAIQNSRNLLKTQSYYILLGLLSLISYSISAQNLTPKKQDGKWGYVDQNKEWVLKPALETAHKFKEGFALIQKKGKYGFINEYGKTVIKPTFFKAADFNEGFAPVCQYIEGQEKWGYINTSGELIINYHFKKVRHFKNGIAIVSSFKMQPLEKIMIDVSGKPISPPYLKATPNKDGHLFLMNKRADKVPVYCYIKNDGTKLTDWYLNQFELGFPNQKVWLPSMFDDPLTPADAFNGNKAKKLVAILSSNNKIISEWYEEIGEMRFGFVKAKKDHKHGFLNALYQPTATFRYKEIEILDSLNYVAMTFDETFLLLNYIGKPISKEFHGFETFDTDNYKGLSLMLFKEKSSTKEALFSKEGEQTSAWYDVIKPKSNIFYRAIENKQYIDISKDTTFGDWYNYFVDSNGCLISEWRLSSEYRWVSENNRKYKDSIYNFFHAPKTSYVITPSFFNDVFFSEFEFDNSKRTISFNGGDYHDGMAVVAKVLPSKTRHAKGVDFSGRQLKFGFIDWYGELVIPYKFDYVSGFSNGKAIFRQGDLFGAINYKGAIIIKPQFELMGNFGSGLAPVFKDSTWGYCSDRGAISIAFQYDEAFPFYYGFAAVKIGKKWGLIDTQGKLALPMKYRKPPKAISRSKALVLKDGVGYIEIDL